MARVVSSKDSMTTEVMAIEDFPVRKTELPEKEETKDCGDQIPPILTSLERIGRRTAKSKPVYADTWTVGIADGLKVIETYETDQATVVIGTADDGETEYNITPNEYCYPPELDSVVIEAIDHLRDSYRRSGGHLDRIRADAVVTDFLWKNERRISEAISESCDIRDAVKELTDVVCRYTVGRGIFDILLSDPRLEDVYVDAPCDRNRIHVTLNSVGNSNSHIRCRTNLIADGKEMRNIITMLMKQSGLPYCESNPVLETDMEDGEARATVVGYPMSPNGDSLAIRKHSSVPWTLTRLIGNGTIDPRTAGVLSFLVENRTTILVSGARGAGKSSLLSALMFEFPISQRILTIEDTPEFPRGDSG